LEGSEDSEYLKWYGIYFLLQKWYASFIKNGSLY
jgi:hypothetical protein